MSGSNVTESFVDHLCADFDEIAAGFVALKAQAQTIAAASELMTRALLSGKKVIFCGNGGSAADSQHLAAELMGRYLKDRPPLAALSLAVDISSLTAIGNDYGFENVFARQLSGLGKPGDILVAISTSGNSANVIAAVRTARISGIQTIGLTG